ncbi:MAG TPA: DNA-formamidopyrimidine glycosylase family protein [Nitrososphaeraceae archaeon]|nr:DNA-formamidopyrimidine glycosylase family protein [Nitrososphaeraceae archaeon]
MSEGPEVKIIADKISSIVQGKKIDNIICKNLDIHIKNRIVDSELEYIKAFGKNLVFKFSSGIFLRNHMMMWGKWRIYDRSKYDKGLATAPPRRSRKTDLNSSQTAIMEKDVRLDSRVRLTIITNEAVLIEFNGPILQFSTDDPAEKEPIKSLGPDCLNQQIFDVEEIKQRFLIYSKQKDLLISDALLNQKIIAGIGNKYKSEILFVCKINPFKSISQLNLMQQNSLFKEIPKLLKYGYKNAGRTRQLLIGEPNSWNTRHLVFRRAGKECWICKTKIKSEKKLTKRPTFWCPYCQK